MKTHKNKQHHRRWAVGLALALLMGMGSGFGCAATPDAATNNTNNTNQAACDPTQPPTCDGNTLVACGQDREEYRTPCELGCVERGGVAECKSCLAGELLCDGQNLNVCAGDGRLSLHETCEYGCEVGSDACNECRAAEVACQDGDLVACDDQGQIEEVRDCQAGCSEVDLECECTSDRCADEETLEVCGADALVDRRELCAYGCNADPAGARCNECVPGASWCEGDALSVCGEDGRVSSTEQCVLGCNPFATQAECYTFVPTHVAQADLSAGTVDFLPTQSVEVDTDAGTITPSTIAIDSYLLPQANPAPGIRVFRFRDVTIPQGVTVRVRGSKAVAFVASGQISIAGVVDGSAHGAAAGPGGRPGTVANVSGDGANGHWVADEFCTAVLSGGGGGGHAATGGNAGKRVFSKVASPGVGGSMSANTSLSPLIGGFHGGRGELGTSADVGAGGGAILLVSRKSIRIEGTGVIEASGGGGQLNGSGGGAGGSVYLEAPVVTIDGGIRAVGGGGACGKDGGAGQDGRIGGRKCSGAENGSGAASGGAGGLGVGVSGTGGQVGSPILCKTSTQTAGALYQVGGGGGAAGRAWFRTAGASYFTIGASASLTVAPCGANPQGCISHLTPN